MPASEHLIKLYHKYESIDIILYSDIHKFIQYFLGNREFPKLIQYIYRWIKRYIWTYQHIIYICELKSWIKDILRYEAEK